MIRILLYLVLLGLIACGADWLLQRPGHIEITWLGYTVTTNVAVGLVLFVLLVIAVAVIWRLLGALFGLPSFLALASRQRRREKGYAALSRGLIAVGAGDAQNATRASAQASKHLQNDPLAIVLRALAARLSGDRSRAEAAFSELAQRHDTRILGLRGLHEEADGRGDSEAARHFAAEAHRAAPLPWSAQAVLEHHAAESEWEKALATVETSARAKLIDKATSDRQRAVLETAIGLEKQDTAPDEALRLARSAMKKAPDLVPAVALAARLMTRRGEIRKASRLIETVWPHARHPDLARGYLDVRPGDSTTDRLARAQALARITPHDPVARLTVARTALAAKMFAVAREAMAPLVAEGERPSVRACLVMADLEDAEFGDQGHWREWLGRASRAPLDAAWIADSIVYDQWEPVSPTTGRLDAFVWQAPAERPGDLMETMPAPAAPMSAMSAPVVPLPERARADALVLPPERTATVLSSHADTDEGLVEVDPPKTSPDIGARGTDVAVTPRAPSPMLVAPDDPGIAEPAESAALSR